MWTNERGLAVFFSCLCRFEDIDRWSLYSCCVATALFPKASKSRGSTPANSHSASSSSSTASSNQTTKLKRDSVALATLSFAYPITPRCSMAPRVFAALRVSSAFYLSLDRSRFRPATYTPILPRRAMGESAPLPRSHLRKTPRPPGARAGVCATNRPRLTPSRATLPWKNLV